MAKALPPETVRILWAVDPYARKGEVQRESARAIQAWARRQPAVVIPVYVASDPRHRIPPQLRAKYIREVKADGQDEVDAWIGALPPPRLARLEPLKVLGPTGSSLNEQVQSLIEHAHEENVSLIVLGTRARRGPPRWFFGSFVETLSLTSDIPILVINPNWTSAKSSRELASAFNRILFPTDFSDESHTALQRLLPAAIRMKSEITLFHKVTMNLSVMPEAAISMVSLTEESLHAELEVSRRKAASWCREIRHSGVKCEWIIDSREGESVAASVIKEIRSRPGMIAMAGQSTPMETRLLGSVTRQLLRESPAPVWVLHPSPREEEQVGRRAA